MMNTYRIFTNDRPSRKGVRMYSALMEVKATSPETAQSKAERKTGIHCIPIRWPASKQSDDEKEWLKRHVG